VIHSFFVPQFRVKKDAVPGRFNTLWFQATELSPPEGFDIFCTEYCGTGHSKMRSHAFVHDMTGFKSKLDELADWEKQPGMTSVKAGEKFVQTRGCLQCHNLEGRKGIGPALNNVYGEEQTLRDGTKVVADADYIRESIHDPAAKIVAGFEPQMPSYRGSLTDKDVRAIADYLRSISDRHKDDPSLFGAATAPAASAPSTAPVNN
jgi:cytochrome c oxidase subunit 2